MKTPTLLALIGCVLALALFRFLGPSSSHEASSSSTSPVGRRAHDAMAEQQQQQPAFDGAPEDIYSGPPIGSVAKDEWPELVGLDVDDAVARIEGERPDLLMVRPTKEGSIVSMDFAVRRVRVRGRVVGNDDFAALHAAGLGAASTTRLSAPATSQRLAGWMR